jgi:hypothetical protein
MMDIVQLDAKTIRIEKAGFTFFLRYYFLWDGTLRMPESIVLDGASVKAFFLTSVIRDTIAEAENGFFVTREWNIVPSGEIVLYMSLDLQASKNVPFFFPCLARENSVSREPYSVIGERLSFPSSVFLYQDGKGIFISLDAPESAAEQASIGIERSAFDGVPCVRAEIAFPPREKLDEQIAGKVGFVHAPRESVMTIEGNLKKRAQLNVLIAPEKEIFPFASGFYLAKLKDTNALDFGQTKGAMLKMIREGIDKCLLSLLVDNNGVYGPRTSEDAGIVDSLVCAGLSELVQRVYDVNFDMNEVSLRLVDFCLKSQHPRGIFLERYDLAAKKWRCCEMSGRTSRSAKRGDRAAAEAVTHIAHSARTAAHLFTLSTILEERGHTGVKYFLAGKRFIESLFDFKKKGIIEIGSIVGLDSFEPIERSKACLELIPPLATIFGITGDDRYRKAIVAIKNEFFVETFPYTALPSEDEDTDPDFSTSLLFLRTAIELEKLGIRVRDREAFVNMVLPWVYFNRSQTEVACSLRPYAGGMIDSFDRCRIIYRNFELAHSLLAIAGLVDEKPLVKMLWSLASYLIDSGERIPIGTPWFHHTSYNAEPKGRNGKPIEGGFDARSFVREAGFLFRCITEFPEVVK